MGYEYKCSCGAEFNQPGVDSIRREKKLLYWQYCPFCMKLMYLLPPGLSWEEVVKSMPPPEQKAPEVKPVENPPQSQGEVPKQTGNVTIFQGEKDTEELNDEESTNEEKTANTVPEDPLEESDVEYGGADFPDEDK